MLLIGATRYSSEKLPDVPVVEATITDLANILTDPSTGIVDKRNCSVILNEGDLRKIGTELRRCIRTASDLLLVYFTGHGLIGGKRHELYLGLPDSDWAEPEFNSLEYDKLRSAVLDSPAITKIVILDCCFSGRAVSDTLAPRDAILGQLEVSGSYVLTSAERDQLALVLPGEKYTAFSGRLITALRDGIPEGPDLLTIDDLYKHLAARMKAEGLPVPIKRGTNTADMLALGYNKASRGADPDDLRRRASEAFSVGQRGDWKGAVGQLMEILSQQERLLGRTHKDTLWTRIRLAHAIGGEGQPGEASRLISGALADVLDSINPDDPEALQARQYLAVNLGEAGAPSEAVGLLRTLLWDRRRVLGNDDEHTLRTAHMLARNLIHVDELEEAAAILKEVAESRKRLLGDDHEHTRRAYIDLRELSK